MQANASIAFLHCIKPEPEAYSCIASGILAPLWSNYILSIIIYAICLLHMKDLGLHSNRMFFGFIKPFMSLLNANPQREAKPIWCLSGVSRNGHWDGTYCTVHFYLLYSLSALIELLHSVSRSSLHDWKCYFLLVSMRWFSCSQRKWRL